MNNLHLLKLFLIRGFDINSSNEEEPLSPDIRPDNSGPDQDDDRSEIISDFLVESYENLDQLDQELISLEQNPSDKNIISSIFRTIHTIKGTCGFIGFSKLECVAHVGEDLLGKLRDGEIELTPLHASALLRMVDAIREMLSCIERDKTEGDLDYVDLVETLTKLKTETGISEAITPSVVVNPELEKDQTSVIPDAAKEEKTTDTANEDAGQHCTEIDEDILPIVNDFLIESYESLDCLDKDLVELEQDPCNKEILGRIFRAIHTIKGTCGFIGLHKLEKISHVGENLLGKLRDGEIVLNPSRTSALLGMIDAIRQILGCIEKDRNEGEQDYSKLVTTLDKLLTDKGVIQTSVSTTVLDETVESKEDRKFVPAAEKKDRRQGSIDDQNKFLSKNEDRRISNRRSNTTRTVTESSIRVDVNILDRLMNLVGELVLARNQILQFVPTDQDSSFISTSQRLNMITTELQEGVMKTRMQPIGNIWSKFPRIVRDLSIATGKKIRLEMEGKDTELDKTLIEAIKDPLTHIIRNSCDHGIETPEKRLENGKNEEGILLLRAFHEGGQVNIEIIDDGGGINPQKIKKIAIEKNVVSEEQANKMGDRELVNLIFSAGFSTAEKVTNVSGRGVGMDVVRTNIEKIGGSVDIQSSPGKGTSLRVKVPLTLAIIPALIITTAGERYAIPQVNLVELVRLDGDRSKKSIEFIQGTPVYRLRSNLLPIIYLNNELQERKLEESDSTNIVVLHADNSQFGMVVEGIIGTEEIVVKPLSKQLKSIAIFSGATIMGDGKLALILDVKGIAQNSRVTSEQHDKSVLKPSKKHENNDSKQTLLIFSIEANDRIAIPLSEVARLEIFKYSDLEHSGEQDVVQYRGEIMPLIYLKDFLNTQPLGKKSKKELMPAVVFTKNERSFALVVDRIIDIVEEEVGVQRKTNRSGLLGSIIVQNRVTDLLDLEGIVQLADPSFLVKSKTTSLPDKA